LKTGIGKGLKFAYAKKDNSSKSNNNEGTSVVTDESQSLDDLMSQLEGLGSE
tara:strand:- start:240 stop:395 length:156 start_codon:yes stop_codon:yes gene_type:complete